MHLKNQNTLVVRPNLYEQTIQNTEKHGFVILGPSVHMTNGMGWTVLYWTLQLQEYQRDMQRCSFDKPPHMAGTSALVANKTLV